MVGVSIYLFFPLFVMNHFDWSIIVPKQKKPPKENWKLKLWRLPGKGLFVWRWSAPHFWPTYASEGENFGQSIWDKSVVLLGMTTRNTLGNMVGNTKLYPPVCYIGAKKTTLAKTYGIEVWCYLEHLGEHFGNLMWTLIIRFSQIWRYTKYKSRKH